MTKRPFLVLETLGTVPYADLENTKYINLETIDDGNGWSPKMREVLVLGGLGARTKDSLKHHGKYIEAHGKRYAPCAYLFELFDKNHTPTEYRDKKLNLERLFDD